MNRYLQRIRAIVDKIIIATIEEAKGIKNLIKEGDWGTLVILLLLIVCPSLFAYWLGTQTVSVPETATTTANTQIMDSIQFEGTSNAPILNNVGNTTLN